MVKVPESQYVYRHFKGNLYVVVGEAQHTETMEKLVIYQDVDHDHSPNKTWARPYDMFHNDRVANPNPDGEGTVKRFRRVGVLRNGRVSMFSDEASDEKETS